MGETAAEVTIPAWRIGEIFGICHDMYKAVYDMDDEAWKEEGKDEAPRMGPKIINRAHGKYVWGHDMDDLVFEWVGFTTNPEWPEAKRARRFVKRKGLSLVGDDGKIFEEKAVMIMDPLDPEKHSEEPPFIGTFTFMIGS